MFEGMNAGGRPFWLALSAGVALAAAASWSFLSGPEAATRSASDPLPSAVDLDSLVEEVADQTAPEERAADVTFSFAVEVKRFDDGTVLEQDDLHRMTCRAPSGDARWEIGMEGPLLGAYRFDANDDGTDEFLLVDGVHAIGLDAGGRPIPGFSIRPNRDITAHAVVDYDGKGEERYLLGLSDGRLLNHRKLGEATPGWRHVSKGAAIQSVAHLRAGRKDYLCTVDEKGVVMLLKRSGQRRVRTPAQLHPQEGPRAVAYEVRSDIGSSILVSRNAEGEVECRRFEDGIAGPASSAEIRLLETVEARLPDPEAP